MVLLAAFILFFATVLYAAAAASSPSITTQLNIKTKVKSVLQDYDARSSSRQLQSFSITDMLTLTNSSCPTNCPLCDCTYQNFTSEDEELQCTLNKSIEACSTNTFQSCYEDILNDTPFDIEGLCTVECKDGDGSAAVSPTSQGTSDSRALCQICNIFSCCTNCPSDKAAECFPSNIEDGYTPAGWEPLSCSDSSGGVSLVVGGSWSWSALPLILLSNHMSLFIACLIYIN